MYMSTYAALKLMATLVMFCQRPFKQFGFFLQYAAMSDFSKPESISEQSVNIMRTLTHGISKCLEQFSQIPDDIKFSEETYGKFCAYLQQACLCLYHQQQSYQYAYVVEFIDLVKQLLCQKIFKPLYDVQLKKMAPLKDQ